VGGLYRSSRGRPATATRSRHGQGPCSAGESGPAERRQRRAGITSTQRHHLHQPDAPPVAGTAGGGREPRRGGATRHKDVPRKQKKKHVRGSAAQGDKKQQEATMSPRPLRPERRAPRPFGRGACRPNTLRRRALLFYSCRPFLMCLACPLPTSCTSSLAGGGATITARGRRARRPGSGQPVSELQATQPGKQGC